MTTKNKRAAASKQPARQVHLGVHVFKLANQTVIANVKSVTMSGARWHVENPLLLELERTDGENRPVITRWEGRLDHDKATVLHAEAFLADPRPTDSRMADFYGQVVDRISQAEQMDPEAAVGVEIRAEDGGFAIN